MKRYTLRVASKVEVFAQEFRTLTERLRTAASPHEQAVLQVSLNVVYRRLDYYRGRARHFNLDPALFEQLPEALQVRP